MGKKGFHKSLQIYFSKLKRPTLHLQNLPNPTTNTTSWLLSACKYPKTPSFAVDRDLPNDHDPAATLSDVDRFLFENFNSLYTRDDDDDDFEAGTESNEFSSESQRFTDLPSEGIHASQRFFVSPGTSNSLIEEARLSAVSSSSEVGPAIPNESVAVMTFSKDPYEDFRRSIQEMVDARHVDPLQPLDWDFMEELLFCFLELNDKGVHKYILGAFADLTVSFRRRIPADRRKIPATRGGRRKAREAKVV